MNERLKYIQDNIAKLKDDLQHYTMVEKNSVLVSQIKYDLENLTEIKEHLEDKEKYEDFVQEICDYLGLDNLFPYNNLKEIEKQIKTIADNSHWIAVMQDQKKIEALEVIKTKKVWVAYLLKCDTCEDYNNGIFDFGKENHLTQEEFNLLRGNL